MYNWNVTPILAGEFGMVRDDIKYRNGDVSNSEMVPSLIYKLSCEDEIVMVDCGFSTPEIYNDMGLEIKREGTFFDIIENNGIDRTKVRHLILTHLHWDHAGNCSLFPNAKIYCQSRELMGIKEHPDIYSPEYLQDFYNSKDRVFLLNGKKELLPGITIDYCGGHTYGSQYVTIHNNGITTIITGDTVMTYKNIKDNTPVGLAVNGTECEAMLEWINKSKPNWILPSHDYKTLKYQKYGKDLV
ncbi:MBL fold metallo-hydrolase [Clostridium sp. C105KSO13]|uniref:MBL fold metallo-hydrolase n=1 Tax=Clostridium sp. C105KSO13 TaxID=1776045 RepID=UPI00074060E8|nr:MBL fold metallo-hydrolase [Clostridium sp. C105KSO13]CUX38682.1 N-acyl homoserine lactonase [Clostridium sp. C105KSO13]